MSRFGIVGGGMLGMTIGWNLVKAGHDVTIFEAAPRCGGLAGRDGRRNVVGVKRRDLQIQGSGS